MNVWLYFFIQIVLYDFLMTCVSNNTGTQSCWNRRTRRSRFTATGTPRTTTWRRGTRGRRLETAGRTKSMTPPNGRRHWRRTRATWRGWRGTRASKSVWTPFSVSFLVFYIPLREKCGTQSILFFRSFPKINPIRANSKFRYNYLTRLQIFEILVEWKENTMRSTRVEHVFVKLFIDNAISVTQRSIEVHCYAWQVYRKSHREGHDANGTIAADR